jgi:2-oxo-3-hexenedioate decarboxylase
MNQNLIIQYAQKLDQARLSREEIDSLFHNGEKFSLEEAYSIQRHGIDLRLKAGEKILGFKMGLTSKAKMVQMNLHTPIYGVLTSSMLIQSTEFNFQKLIHPKIEPEIAFITSKNLSTPLTLEQAPEYISHFCPALEILDSRFRGFKYFTLEDVIADNASSSHFVLGEKIPVSQVVDPIKSLPDFLLKFTENNELKHSEKLSAILDHPLLSLVELSKMFALEKREIPAGSIILAGAVTPALALQSKSEFKNEIESLGIAKLIVFH